MLLCKKKNQIKKKTVITMEAGEEDFNWLLYVLMTFLGF